MSVDVAGGTFYIENYGPLTGEGTVGARMALEFRPNEAYRSVEGADGTVLEFHLVQIVRELHGDAGPSAPAAQGNVGYEHREVASGEHRGWGVDVDWMAAGDDGYRRIAEARREQLAKRVADADAPRAEIDALTWQQEVDKVKLNKFGGRSGRGKVLTSLDPRYAQQRVAAAVPPYTARGTGVAGNALVLAPPYPRLGPDSRAALRDAPAVPIGNPMPGMAFEVAALLDYGPPDARRSAYLGSVSWGWHRTAGRSDVTVDDLRVASHQGVSAAFAAAARHWNGLSVIDPWRPEAGARPVLPLPEA